MTVINCWLTKAQAKKVRREYMLKHLDNLKQLPYIAKIDLGNPGACARRTWMVVLSE